MSTVRLRAALPARTGNPITALLRRQHHDITPDALARHAEAEREARRARDRVDAWRTTWHLHGGQ